MQTNTYLTTSAFTNPFLSFLERRRRPENIIVILNLFFVRETSRFNFIYVTRDRELVQHHDVYAPINVKPAGEGRQGMGWVFDIFQKFAVKFPAHGHIIPVKCNQISPLRAAHCAVKYPKAGRKKRTIKIFPNKTLKSLFILRCSITKDTCSCYSCNYTF